MVAPRRLLGYCVPLTTVDLCVPDPNEHCFASEATETGTGESGSSFLQPQNSGQNFLTRSDSLLSGGNGDGVLLSG